MQALTEAPLLARADGYLKSRSVDIGDHVRTGQTLAIIDAPELDHQIRQAEAAIDQSQAAVDQAQASVEQAQANLSQGRTNLELARVTADRYKTLTAAGRGFQTGQRSIPGATGLADRELAGSG